MADNGSNGIPLQGEPAAGSRLKAHRLRAGLTQAEVAEALAALAWEQDQEHLGVDGTMVSKWERGIKRPRKLYRRLLCSLYGVTEEGLGLRRPGPIAAPYGNDLNRGDFLAGTDSRRLSGSLAALVAASTAEATALLGEAARAEYDQSLLSGQAYDEANWLATAYLTCPPAPLLAEAFERRRHILALLHDHIPLSKASDLYLVAALLSGITAYACLDLGHPEAAVVQTEAGLVCAGFAGHDGLRAWMYGTQSLIARFQGRYSQALDLARQGLDYATAGTAQDRLRSGEAQSLACLGDRAGARRALDLADAARAFTEAKHAYYAGSALIWLPELEESRIAEDQSSRAIELFSAGPADQRNVADEALAHVYLGTARVTLGDVDGVLEAIRPVLDIPPDQRISWQRKRLARLRDMLDAQRFQHSPLVAAVQEEISAFTTDAPADPA